jgi:hypothetical protein
MERNFCFPFCPFCSGFPIVPLLIYFLQRNTRNNGNGTEFLFSFLSVLFRLSAYSVVNLFFICSVFNGCRDCGGGAAKKFFIFGKFYEDYPNLSVCVT